MARPIGTTRSDMVQGDLTLRLNKEAWEWFKSLPKGTKAKVIRDAIALYRSQNQQEGQLMAVTKSTLRNV